MNLNLNSNMNFSEGSITIAIYVKTIWFAHLCDMTEYMFQIKLLLVV